ncbi:DUF664 domain-containing protein [Kibdelosporangium aridum]|uniref:DUF664 domain-containing protein n=1 Tax=Kibdelosporangium aridum TaxID=2030 RepID=A0A428ZHF7_KIBAR|nr:DUF664 domain-containing protein [Kibdelosporangium aridum]RSM87532.1 DUF664 domain-containing protein [Kibdelosporangium aridum]
MITRDQYVYFADRALNGMIDIVREVGEDLANRRPSLPGANSPYGLLTHCLGVVSYWAGWLVAGRPVERDRDEEFTASGPVGPLLDRARAVTAQLAVDVSTVDPRAPLHDTPSRSFLGPQIPLDRGGALMHVYEELAQHHGQMEILRDALRTEFAR